MDTEHLVAPPARSGLVGVGDFEAQARRLFENMRTVLEQSGASLDDVVKVTVFLTDMGCLRDDARVRNEFVNTNAPPAHQRSR
jgi:enamine deaminase RidA (YjgF/YER057c/UK114 family)